VAIATVQRTFEFFQPLGAGRLRGLLLRKLMEELLTGELIESAGVVVQRASELLLQLVVQAAVAELLAALQLPAQIVSRELAAAQPISFAAASNRRVIGSMNEYVWQLGSYLTRTGDPLELSLQLNETPMSAVGSKSNYGIPAAVARELLMSWEQ
jgi:hypothetical protein